MSFVCPIHERYVPDGERCMYCVEPPAPADSMNTSIWAGWTLDANGVLRIPAGEIEWMPLSMAPGTTSFSGIVTGISGKQAK